MSPAVSPSMRLCRQFTDAVNRPDENGTLSQTGEAGAAEGSAWLCLLENGLDARPSRRPHPYLRSGGPAKGLTKEGLAPCDPFGLAGLRAQLSGGQSKLGWQRLVLTLQDALGARRTHWGLARKRDRTRCVLIGLAATMVPCIWVCTIGTK